MNPTLVALLAITLMSASDLMMRALGFHLGVGAVVLWTNVALAGCVAGFLWARHESFWPKDGKTALWASLFRALATALSVMALRRLPVSQYYMVLYLFPVWMTLGGVLFLKERPHRVQWAGLALALLGCGVVFGRGGISWGMGTLTALLCGIFLAGQLLSVRKLGEESVLCVSWVGACVSMLLGVGLLPFDGATENLTGGLSWDSGLLLAGIIVANIAGPMCSFYAAGRLPSVVYGLLCYLQIPLAVVGAWFFMREDVSPTLMVGLILLVLGSLTSRAPKTLEPRDVRLTTP
jgi:S-adenosylmethionine uptake transporter